MVPLSRAAAAKAVENSGLKPLADQNGQYEDGWFACTISNHPDDHRVSSAMGFLNDDVRRRSNLHIRSETQVEQILFDGTKATGLRIASKGKTGKVSGQEIIVSAGALHTPALLMRSGVGRAAHLREHDVGVVADRAGVGANLNEHPTIAVSAYLVDDARLQALDKRHAHVGFRYSSGIADCGAQDMYASITAKSAWHAVGVRLGSFLLWCNKPYFAGECRTGVR